MRAPLICAVIISCLVAASLSLRSKLFRSNEIYENALFSGEFQVKKLHQKPKHQYKFENAWVAFKLLENFTKEEVIPTSYDLNPNSLELKRDPGYCRKAMKAFVNNPGFLFNKLSFVSDYLKNSLLREKIIPMVGYDAMPYAYSQKHDGFLGLQPPYEIDPLINNIYTKISYESKYQLGVFLGCITQNFNHIAGANQIANKDSVALNLKNYQLKYRSQPACSVGKSFFPETWILKDKRDCIEWFNYIKSSAYQSEKAQKSIVFIRKIGVGVHRGKGVAPVDDEEETYLRKEYSNGELCGKATHNMIVQRYINNPLLVEGHKFDFRVYMMISSTDPLTVYYHDGFLRVSLYEYDVNSKVKGVHLTNTAQSEEVFKDLEIQKMMGMNETELRNFQMWSYTRLAEYLISQGKIESMAWIDEYLRPKIEHAMQHLVRMAKDGLQKRPNIWELYGVDFMLDEELNLWFIECNVGPVIKATSEEKGEFLKKMFKDAFEITSAQLRSRMKRVIKFINTLTNEGFAERDPNNQQEIFIKNAEGNKKLFNDLLRNKIEDEFAISAENSWVKIIDESLTGTARYNGMFPAECVD